MKHIAVLFGGRSSEYEVSLSSAYAVLSNIDRTAFDVTMIGITREGAWRLYEGDLGAISDNTWYRDTLPEVRINMTKGTLCAVENGCEREFPCDCVFAVLHGACGEDGTMQGLFEVCGIPMVGCGCTAGAVCMDKALTKFIVGMETDIPMARMVIAHRETTTSVDALRARCEETLGYPMFVKPACAGSSVGASKVKSAEAFGEAIAVAFAEGDKILIEECITGSEIELAVFEKGGEYTVSVPAEIDIGSSEFYDYDTKYISDASSFHIPARLSAEDTARVRDYALTIFKVLGCRGLSRVDFFHAGDGRIVFNEINTIPGFTPISMYPRLMIHAGISYGALITGLIDSALGEK